MKTATILFLLFFIFKTSIIAQNPSIVKDINPTGGSNPNYFSKTSTNKIRFVADDGTHGSELWETDGTTSGTFMIKDLNPGIDGGIFINQVPPMLTINNISYYEGTDNNTGYELWKTDGTASGTTLVKDINPGGAHSRHIGAIIEINGILYFCVGDPGSGIPGAWKSLTL